MSVCVPDTGANIEVKGAIIMSLKIVVRGVDVVIKSYRPRRQTT